MPKKFALIEDGQGTCAEEITRLTGRYAVDTPAGILVADDDPIAETALMMAEFERLFNPPTQGCGCGKMAIMHRPGCPLWLVS